MKEKATYPPWRCIHDCYDCSYILIREANEFEVSDGKFVLGDRDVESGLFVCKEY